MKKKYFSICVLIILCVIFGGCDGNEVTTGEYDVTYIDIINRMTDLKGLAQTPQWEEKCFESSSYEKKSQYNEETDTYINWAANEDDGRDLPQTENGEYIFADIKGPGAIIRLWSAMPEDGHVKIYIDDSETPVIDIPFKNLFENGEEPFNLPMLSYEAGRGKNCYVPITFSKSCKVVAEKGWGRYYQLQYMTFGSDVRVEPFALPLKEEEKEALKRVNDLFSNTANAVDLKNVFQLSANTETELFNSQYSGAVTKMYIKINDLSDPAEIWKALSDMTIYAYWDGETLPSIWAPLGSYFGSPTGTNEYHSYPLGVLSDGTMYSQWYMPFNSAKIILKNNSESAYNISYEIVTEELKEAQANELMRFHAKWIRADEAERGEKWPETAFLKTEGNGRFVGTSLHIYKEYGVGDPESHPEWWWGEGDEKFYIDSEKFPSWFGTGSEDYFGYAWGDWSHFSKPYHAQPFTNGGMWGIGNRLNNRFHIIDSVPFKESFTGTFEKYHRDGYSNWAFTNYWYLSKGGVDSYKEKPHNEYSEYYKSPYPEALLFYEGEDLDIIESTGMMKAETQDMKVFQTAEYKWSNTAQIIFKAEKTQAYVKFRICIPEDGNYTMTLNYTLAPDFGIIKNFIDGNEIGESQDLYNGKVICEESEIGNVYLTKGYHDYTIKVTGKNSKSSGYFCGLDRLEFKLQR